MTAEVADPAREGGGGESKFKDLLKFTRIYTFSIVMLPSMPPIFQNQMKKIWSGL